jgi:hypothetical protein
LSTEKAAFYYYDYVFIEVLINNHRKTAPALVAPWKVNQKMGKKNRRPGCGGWTNRGLNLLQGASERRKASSRFVGRGRLNR